MRASRTCASHGDGQDHARMHDKEIEVSACSVIKHVRKSKKSVD